MGKPPRGEALPFDEETFAAAFKKLNADSAYRKKTKNLNCVIAFEYPGRQRVTAAIKKGELEIIPERLHAKEDAAVAFTEKGWTELNAGDSPNKLFLMGRMRITGDVNTLAPYADAFAELGKKLAER